MPVDDAKQNTHRWWGTLKVENGENITVENEPPLQPGNYFFIKTNPDVHFVSHGTRIKKVKRCPSEDAAKDAIRNSIKDPSPANIAVLNSDLNKPDFPKSNIFEIMEIDYVNTPPLTLELNQKTHDLFWNDPWLNANGVKVGKDHIKIGREEKI